MDSYGDGGVREGDDAPGTPAQTPAQTPAEGASAPASDPLADRTAIAGTAPSADTSPGPSAAPDRPAQVPGAGVLALSLPSQVIAAVALAVIGVFACVHLAMVFLHVAPSNTVTKQHGDAVDGWIFPEFEQNWKLFAPNPLQQNVAVQARAEIAADDGTRRTSDWIDLSAQDAAAIRGSLLPSHVDQNELRRGFDFYLNSHTDDFRPRGVRGSLSERYMRRIVMLRLDGESLGGTVRQIQLRSKTRAVQSPSWSGVRINTQPAYRVLPWWQVTAADLPAGGRSDDRTEAGR
ncbi:DUF5819 family protein [Streptomyces sp. NBC_01216]|uniref:DUF5819 family protein n=1 Tax=Streptomyces sp. NBC_01216 TaxID=2903778 RepID=UPI002E0FE282|nr:DUF5819 family protein [Streptomyces sp. NBC_01216]